MNRKSTVSATAVTDVEARFEAVVETIVDAIMTIDEFGTIDFLNSAAERMFGYSRQDLIGRNVNVLMPEPDSSRHDGYLRSYVQTGIAKVIGIGREVVGKRSDGTLFPLELAVSEVKIQDRRLFTGILRDLTERRKIEQQLLAARQAATAASRAKSQFLRHLGHDLRTPLTPIMGYTELLKETPLNEDQQDAVNAIQRNGELLVAQITEVLDAVVEYESQFEEQPHPHASEPLVEMVDQPAGSTFTFLSSPCSAAADRSNSPAPCVLVVEDSIENL